MTRRAPMLVTCGVAAALALVPLVAGDPRHPVAGADSPLGTALRASAPSVPVLGRGGPAGVLAVRVDNAAGAQAATAVTTSLLLPADVDLATGVAGATAGCVQVDRLVTCPVGAVAAGRSTTIGVGVRVQRPTATVGSRSAVLLPPRSAQWDPLAGELLAREWDHEADGEGDPLDTCWPLTADSPLTDIGGGGHGESEACDGVADHPALVADRSAVLDQFPAPFHARVTRSWEWRTTITPPRTGAYAACEDDADDGALVAIDDGRGGAFTTLLTTRLYDTVNATSPPVTLDAGRTYQVVVRISNRGHDGIDNGGTGPGGWDGLGIIDAAGPCNDDTAAASFGTGPTDWTPRVTAPITVAGTADLAVTGTSWGTTPDGHRWVQARSVNRGPDATSGGGVSLQLPAGWRPTSLPAGCARSDRLVTCGSTAGPAGSEQVVDLTLEREPGGTVDAAQPGTWSSAATGSVDPTPADAVDTTGRF